jgi:uncharacterized damage-inducible protein DinB
MATPDWRFILRENFDYDLYANRLWLAQLSSDLGGPEARIMKHILSASRIWATRIGGVSPSTMPDVPLCEESLVDLHDQWLTHVDRDDYERQIAYRNTRGDALIRAFGDICRHVVNHGTYHRGQMREIAGGRDLDFPETDFMGFTFARDEAS